MPINRRDFLASGALAAAGMLLVPASRLSARSSGLAADGAGLRFRQVHLDYHTSEKITDVAADFDPAQFAETLKKAHVNSVTAFGRCHHGWIYHDTSRFPERRHPALTRNLLKEQIDACHKVDIRVPVYVTVQWDHYTAIRHPEWLMRDHQGAPFATGSGPDQFAAGFYNHLCVATPYYDFLKAYIADLFENVPVDGLFLDIHHVRANANRECIEGMLRKGLDPSVESVRYNYYRNVIDDYKKDLSEFVWKLDRQCRIFYNGGHIGPHIRQTVPQYSHFELESLPSGGWGYVHFPLTSRYARTLGKDVMGMTGKFHTSWGDFHSLKNPAALEFETNMMLAMNARCSIGDQLHPRGKLDEATYLLIGKVYGGVAAKEPWCANATPVTEIGVLSAEEFVDMRTPDMMTGAVKILQEGSLQFDVLDSQSDFSRYRLLILPDAIVVNEALAAKLAQYLRAGGAVIASYHSGLAPDRSSFALGEWGVSLVGDAPYSPDFLVMDGPLAAGLPKTELVMYRKGMEVRAGDGAAILSMVNVPYFNRTWEHFSSHRHTPSSGKAGYPGIVQNGRVIYFAHPVFAQYGSNAAYWCKRIVLNAIARLMPDPLVTHNGPSSVITAVNEQTSQRRAIVHVLHYVPERRGSEFDTIEDVLPLHDLRLSLRLPSRPARARLVPEGVNVPLRREGGRYVIELRKLNGHQMIELTYA